MTTLLDTNVLVALLMDDHVHHEAAVAWLRDTADTFATCPITEGSLVRSVIREGQRTADARAALQSLAEHPRYAFWPDDLSYLDVPLAGVIGHRQVTDAYLVHLARARNGRMATFDRALAAQHQDIVELVPTS